MPRPWLAGVLLAGVLTACGGDADEPGLTPVIEDIEPAIAALEAELGGPQRYFEINASPQLVNLFVADEVGGEVVPYVYAAGELQAPGPASPVSGGTPFASSDLVADLAPILDGVTDELPDSDVSVFVIYPDDAGAPRYGATVVSEQGGVLDVDLGPDGAVLAVDPRT